MKTSSPNLLLPNRVSNSALHWILPNENTRMSTIRGVSSCLKPGGSLCFEFAGHGHTVEVFTAVHCILLQYGYSLEQIKEIDPWFLPTVAWMKKALEDAGFTVEQLEYEYRPTQMTSAHGGGLEGYIKLFLAPILAYIPAEKREEVVKQMCGILELVVTHEDGTQWLGYVRLRGMARKL